MANSIHFDLNCIFCKIASGSIKTDIIDETENLMVIKDINPQAPIHYLIIPKEHIVDIQSMSKENLLLGSEFFQIAQKLSKNLPGDSSFKLINNNGYAAGQRVFHFHVHFLAKLPEHFSQF